MPEPVWWGWEIPDHPPSIPPGARRLVARATGWRPRPTPRVDRVTLPPAALPDAARAALAAVVGAGHVRSDHGSRLQHAGGKSYVDLIRRRAGDATGPDAVVTPADHRQVADVLAVCDEHRIAVVPFGGGTSVVGGVEPDRGGFPAVIALDLGRLDRLLGIDTESGTARLEAGLRTAQAETLLAPYGQTLGHTPQSARFATIGGYAATRSAGQSSTGFGRFDDLVVGLRAATPTGDLVLGHAPRSAAGPDLRQLLLGSEGAFGVITDVTLRIRPAPDARRYDGFAFPTFAAGLAAVRELVQGGLAPDVVRVSDAEETRLALADAAVARRLLLVRRRRSLAILGWEGTAATVGARRAAAVRVLRRHRAARLGRTPGEAWQRERFAAPYLRDHLLDLGLLVETLETATSWSRLPALHAAISAALAAALDRPYVTTHVSHAYPTGASLYLTVLADRDDRDPVGQWQRAKRAAGAAIVATGGTITHHHGVGLEHRDLLPDEIGAAGIQVLRAVKWALDPTGIMNPGKLLPPNP